LHMTSETSNLLTSSGTARQAFEGQDVEASRYDENNLFQIDS
jgi:hypothetical protein